MTGADGARGAGAPPALPPLPAVPRVSVLTLAYNHEAFIAEAIESVLAQEWPADRLQHVVLDDGSTDGTRRVLDRYRSVVTVVEHDRNRGMNASVDHAMSLLTGDVITVVDGDDAMLPGRIERLVAALRAHPRAGLAYSDGELIDRHGRVLAPSFIDAAKLPRLSGRVRGRLLERNFVSGGALMLRGCLLPLIHPLPPYAAWPDYWWAWAISGVAEIVHVPEPTYRYRSHGANQTLTARDRLAANYAKELPFRLRTLADVAADEATAAELVRGVAAVRRMLDHAAAEVAEVVAPTAAGRREALRQLERAVAALDAGDVHGAALACARLASVHLADPALLALLPAVAAAREGGPPPAGDRRLLDEHGARAAAALVDAAALVAQPELLDGYAARIPADADVTLVIHAAPSDGAAVDAVAALVAARGLDGDDGPDMVLVSEPPARLRALAAGADAILGPPPFADAGPCFGVDDLDALALLLRWRARARARAGAALNPGAAGPITGA